MRTLVLIILLALATAFLSASVLPWFPFFRWLPVIALLPVLLIVARVRPSHVLAFAAGTAVLTDAISGFPVGVRTVALLGGIVLLWPIVRAYTLHRHTIALLAIAIALAGLDALAVAAAAGGFPPARWFALLQVMWPAVAWGIAVVLVIQRYYATRQRV